MSQIRRKFKELYPYCSIRKVRGTENLYRIYDFYYGIYRGGYDYYYTQEELEELVSD